MSLIRGYLLRGLGNCLTVSITYSFTPIHPDKQGLRVNWLFAGAFLLGFSQAELLGFSQAELLGHVDSSYIRARAKLHEESGGKRTKLTDTQYRR